MNNKHLIKGWAKKYDRCRICKRTDRSHVAKGLCRPCYMTEYYKAHPDLYAKDLATKNNDYRKNPELYIEKNRAYIRTDAGKRTLSRTQKRMAEKYPIKFRARYLLRNAVKKGEIIKPVMCEQYNPHPEIPCFGRLEAHHYLGYEGDHWKDVMWLCIKHHKNIHFRAKLSQLQEVKE